MGFFDRARNNGAKLVTGGRRPEGFEKGYYIAPTIYADVPLDAEIWCDEIFGPVVCVNPFDTEAEAITMANDSPYGLAGAVMSDDLERCDRVATKLRAGVIWVNCSQPTFVQAPWGGFKSSGIGVNWARRAMTPIWKPNRSPALIIGKAGAGIRMARTQNEPEI